MPKFVLFQSLLHYESRLSAQRVPDPLARRIIQVKTARNSDPRVISLENRKDLLNRLANAIVVLDQVLPSHFGVGAEYRARQMRDDPDLATQVGTRGRDVSLRGMDHAHRVLHGDRLRHAVLTIFLAARYARQNVRVPAMYHVASIEFRRNMRGEFQSTNRGADLHRIR